MICPILEIESKLIIIIIYFYNYEYNIICHKSSTFSDQVKFLLILKENILNTIDENSYEDSSDNESVLETHIHHLHSYF